MRRGLPRTSASGIALGLGILFMIAPGIRAFVPLSLHSQYPADVAGLVTKWDLTAHPDGAIPYWINPTIPASFTPFEPTSSIDVILAKVHNAFRTWENVPTSKAKFRVAGLTNATAGSDGRMVVSFSLAPSPSGGPIKINCRYSGQTQSSTGAAGVILPQAFAGQILECDPTIHLLPARGIAWWVGDTAPPAPGPGERQGRADLQGILTHEIGHVLGLDHSGTAKTTTMTMWLSAGDGGFTHHSLWSDDAIGISTLYPEDEFLRSRGSIAGRVVREQDGAPVFGAHVVAVEAATGVIVAGTVTGFHEVGADGMPRRFRRGSGQYLLPGLPPGVYRVYTEPLDGPNTNWLGGVFGLGAEQQFMEKDFTPAFFTEEVTVEAGKTVTDVDLRIASRPLNAPNLDLQAWIVDGRTRVDPVLLRQGSTAAMELAPGENIVTDQGLVAETRFSFFGGGVTITQAEGRRAILLRLSIAPDAPLGPQLLQVTTANGTAFLSGALTVVPDPPIIQTITLESGSRVVVDGVNFAPEAVVHVDGNLASDIVVESPSRIRAVVSGIQQGRMYKVQVIGWGGLAETDWRAGMATAAVRTPYPAPR